MRNRFAAFLVTGCLLTGLASSVHSQDKDGDPASQVILDQPQSVLLLRKNGTQTRVDLVRLTRKDVQFKQPGSNTVLTYTAASGNVRAVYTPDGDYYAVNPQTGEFDRYDLKTNTFGVLSRAEKAQQEALMAKAKAEQAEKARQEAELAKRQAEMKSQRETEMARAKAAEAARDRRAAEQARLEAELTRQESQRANREAERPKPTASDPRLTPNDDVRSTRLLAADSGSAGRGERTTAASGNNSPKPLAITLLVGGSLLFVLGLLGCALHYFNHIESRLHRHEGA